MGTDTAELTWDKVDGATYYQVYQSDRGNEELDAEVSAPGTSYRDRSPNSILGRLLHYHLPCQGLQ